MNEMNDIMKKMTLLNSTAQPRQSLTHEQMLERHAKLTAQKDAEIRQGVMMRAAEAEQKRLTDAITGAGVPRRYSKAAIETLDRQYYPIAAAHVERFYLNFDSALTDGGGMLIYGDVGTGKTMLACALVNSLIAARHTAAYAVFYDVLSSIKSSWKGGGDEREINRALIVPELLVLDEICVQHDTNFERVIASNIMDARSRDCKPTILISNNGPEEVMKMIGRRAYDRLIGFGGTILEMRGSSLRISNGRA